ncbi:hypothetical protein PC120_g25231 [Phytophthora cactorum]|nr:hypothetical protein PC120_g25231 [Phytophthora cactorum]
MHASTSVRWHVQSRVTEFVIADQDELDARHTYGMPVPDREVIDTRHLVGLYALPTTAAVRTASWSGGRGNMLRYFRQTRHFARIRDYRRLWKYISATRAMETMSLRSRNLLIIPICTDGGQ